MASPEQMVTVAGAVTAPPCACKPVIGGDLFLSVLHYYILRTVSHQKYYKQLFYKSCSGKPSCWCIYLGGSRCCHICKSCSICPRLPLIGYLSTPVAEATFVKAGGTSPTQTVAEACPMVPDEVISFKNMSVSPWPYIL